PNAPTLHCAGLFGPSCGEPENRFRSNVRVTWTDNKGDFSLSLRWRHLSSIEFELNGAGVAPHAGFVNNPTPASDVNNNTFPNTYDALGRIIFVGATVKL